ENLRPRHRRDPAVHTHRGLAVQDWPRGAAVAVAAELQLAAGDRRSDGGRLARHPRRANYPVEAVPVPRPVRVRARICDRLRAAAADRLFDAPRHHRRCRADHAARHHRTLGGGVLHTQDFSFLRSVLVWAGVLALVAIVSAVLFGMQLGTWFSVAMIGFAGAAVL